MRKVPVFVIAVFLGFHVRAQVNKTANDAFILTRMVEKFHFQPKPLNDDLSANVYNQFLKQLDAAKIYFTQEDITSFLGYQYKLDDEIKGRKSSFLQAVITAYQKRLMQAETMIIDVCSKPFNFTIAEKFTIAEDSSFPATEAAMRSKFYKLCKASALSSLLDNKSLTALSAAKQKLFVDSIEPVIRKRIQKTYTRQVKTVLQRPGGVQQAVGEEYCKAIALCYDPHTEFFPATEKENFESELGQRSMAFGFTLDEDEDGNIKVDELKPGSPAFKSGQINKGDKIEAVQWEGKEAIDVSGAGKEELSETLSLSNHDKAVLKIRKVDGTTREVALWKETMEDDADNNKVKSFLLKGNKTIGYLSLPSFYEDWDNGSGVNGCANDVAKEIVKLKKENIDGLILDVRYNGGGSMQEAVELAGIFIDAGPVGQVKSKDAKIFTLKDANRGTIYDGPLMVLVNGYSASASEMVAGTLQDYNRAVIVGSPTYGKATAQVVLPMDTAVNLESDLASVKADNYVKVTISQLYRITGKTAQAVGVLPDVSVPDLLEAQNNKESNNVFAIKAKEVDANKYYKPLPPLPINQLNAAAKAKINESAYFQFIKQYINKAKALQQKKDVSLKLSDALAESSNLPHALAADSSLAKAAFTIETNSYEKQRLQANKSLREMDNQWKSFLRQDPYVTLGYDLMLLMTK